jgi:Cu/Zn superoxide dismutase
MNSILRIVRFLVLTLVLSLLVSCNSTVQGDTTASPTSTPSASKPSIAQATISDPSGKSQLNGKVNFTETAKGVLIQVSVKNVPPGPHGFHIHEKETAVTRAMQREGILTRTRLSMESSLPMALLMPMLAT